MAHIAFLPIESLQARLAPGDPFNQRNGVHKAHLRAAAKVKHLAGLSVLRRAESAIDDIRDKRKVAGLLAIIVKRYRFIAQQAAHKDMEAHVGTLTRLVYCQ